MALPAGVVPSATLRTRDGKYAIIGGNGDSVYSRLMAAVGMLFGLAPATAPPTYVACMVHAFHSMLYLKVHASQNLYDGGALGDGRQARHRQQ